MPIVGMVGGGQLARMTQQAAIGLGVSLRVLSESAHAAARVCAEVRIGDHTSLDDLREFALGAAARSHGGDAQPCAAVTFDHEHVPGPHIRALEDAGVACRPGSAALLHAQDKLVMRERLTELGAPCPRFASVGDLADVAVFADRAGWPVVLKTVRGGYDGRGVWVCASIDEAGAVVARADAAGVRLLAEEHVEFRRELAALVARSPHGQGAAYPIVETVQRAGICREVIAPAPGLPDIVAAHAQRLALDIADRLGVVGLLAVELFEAPGDSHGGVLVNELAMRPHNSGHWTIDGARTSQFEQHLRAVLDLPLGATARTAPYAVMANVLGGSDPDVYPRYTHVMAHDPAIKVHFYGKEVRPGRKIGHVTALGDDLDDVRGRAQHAAGYLRGDT